MKHLSTKIMLILAMICFGLIGANAQTYTTLVSGQVYNVPAWGGSYFQYTPPTDGRIIMALGTDQATPSIEFQAPLTQDSEGNPVGPGSKRIGNEIKFSVKAGTTYQFSVWTGYDQATTVTFTYEDEASINLTINEIKPAQGTALSLTDKETIGQVLLYCNFLASYEYVSVSSGDKYSNVKPYNSEKVSLNMVGLEVLDGIMELYNQGMKPGDPITVSVTGLKDDEGRLYNGNGLLTLNYVAAAKPGDLVSNTFLPTKQSPIPNLYSYYPATDTEGVWTFTFSQPVKADIPYKTINDNGFETDCNDTFTHQPLHGPVLYLCGTSDNDACEGFISTTLSADRKTVTVDLRGKNIGNIENASNVSLSSFASYGIEFKIMNLYDEDGNMFLGQPDEGNAGSYGFESNFCLYENQAINGVTWSPAENSSIKNASTVSVSFDDRAHGTKYTSASAFTRTGLVQSFSGIRFTASGVNVLVPASQCTVTTSGNTKTITCSIPEAAKSANSVIAKVEGIVSVDGFSYEDQIRGVFNPAVATGMLTFEPEPGSRVESLTTVTIRTSGVYDSSKLITNDKGRYVFSTPIDGGCLVIMQPGISLDGSDYTDKVADGYQITFTIPANAFKDGDMYSAAQTVTYTIAAPVLDQAYDLTLSPASGSEVYSIADIVLSDGAYAVTPNGMALTNVYLTTPSGSKVYPGNPVVEGNTTKLRFAQQTAQGDYTLTAPQGFFRMGDASDYRISSAINASFTVVPLTLVTDPAVGSVIKGEDAIEWEIDFDKTVNVVESVNGAENQPYIVGMPDYTITIKKDGRGTNVRYYFYADDGSETFTLPDGTYTFVFPAGSITINGEVNPVDVRLTYTFGEDKDFAVTLPGYENNGSYATIGDKENDAQFAVEAAHKAPAIVAYDLINVTDNTWVYGTTLDTETWTAYIPYTRLYVGKTYRLVVRGFDSTEAYNARTTTNAAINAADCVLDATLIGAQPEYVYSDITLTAATPANESVIEPATFNNKVVLTFSGNVTVTSDSKVILPKGTDGEEQDPVDFVSITGSGSTWTLTLDPNAAYMTEYVDLILKVCAVDAQDHALRGSDTGRNLEENSHYRLYYTINNGSDLADITASPANGAAVTNLEAITLSSDEYNLGVDNAAGITLTINGTTVAVSTTLQPDGTVKVTPNSAITTSGTLVLNVAERALILDPKTGLGVKYNKALTATYQYTYVPNKVQLTVSPAAGKVTEIGSITLSYTGSSVNLAAGALLNNAYITGPDGRINFSNTSISGTSLKLNLASEITTPGSYTLTIPEGFVTVGLLNINSAVSINYTINEPVVTPPVDPSALPIKTVPAVGSVNSSLLSFTWSGQNGESITINNAWYFNFDVINVTTGRAFKTENLWEFGAYTTSTFKFGDVGGNEISSAVTEEGKYIVIIPAGTISIGNTTTTEDIQLVYYIGSGHENDVLVNPWDDIELTTDPANNSAVSQLSTITFLHDNFDVGSKYNSYIEKDGKRTTNTVYFSGNRLFINPDITAAGNYTVVLGIGSMKIGAFENTEEYRLTYRIMASGGSKPLNVVVPGGLGINQNTIEISFADMDNSSIDVNDALEDAEISLIENGSESNMLGYLPTYVVNRNSHYNADKKAFVFEVNGPLTRGTTYTLSVPANYFSIADDSYSYKNSAFTTTITVSDGALLDGLDYTRTSASTPTDNIVYTRTIKSADGWQAWYMPFDVTVAELIQGGYLAQNDKDSKYEIIHFEGVEQDPEGDYLARFKVLDRNATVEHNKPYLFIPAAAGEITYTFSPRQLYAAPATEQSVSSGDYELVGNYTTIKGLRTEGSYALAGGMFKTASSDNVVLKPFRARLRPKTMTFAPSKLKVQVRPDTDGIESVVNDLLSGDAVIYDLQGRIVTNPTTGIYIVNGQKILIER